MISDGLSDQSNAGPCLAIGGNSHSAAGDSGATAQSRSQSQPQLPPCNSNNGDNPSPNSRQRRRKRPGNTKNKSSDRRTDQINPATSSPQGSATANSSGRGLRRGQHREGKGRQQQYVETDRGKAEAPRNASSKIAISGGRFFSGSLTTSNSHQGQDHNDGCDRHRSHHGGRPPRSERPATPPSPGADLMTRQTHQLKHNTYECMVCCENIYQRQSTWSCENCWAIFHLRCIRTWARSSTTKPDQPSAPNSNNHGEEAQWRCPGCQFKRTKVPSDYWCFCGKVSNPVYYGRRQTNAPHSCEGVCGKLRGEGCPHTCPLLCHPGPCPPCTDMAPPVRCFCGRRLFERRCGRGLDDKNLGLIAISCGEVCERELACGKHKCDKVCHEGACPPCLVEEEQMCYCGRESRNGTCGNGVLKSTWIEGRTGKDQDEQHQEQAGVEEGGESWRLASGHYSCGRVCGMYYRCCVHRCELACHPHQQPGKFLRCPLDPANVSTCACGKANLKSDLGVQRKSCTDPVPTCQGTCDRVKKDTCGHRCEAPCHNGPCPPCPRSVDLSCLCGKAKQTVLCSDVAEIRGTIRCNNVCDKLRVCGKHKCRVVCCPSSHTDVEGEVIPTLDLPASYITDPHRCELVCGKKLQCGNHFCQMPCHKGRCSPCLEASFDELACPCGRTRLYPPIRCGTAPPRCRFPCTIARECSHIDRVSHECHPEDVPCPPCPVLCTKTCRCSKSEVRNVPCYRKQPQCSERCGKLLPCGGHRCQRVCHSPDEPCLGGGCSVNSSAGNWSDAPRCPHRCMKPRSLCGHPCTLQCHAPSKCSESEPCQAVVTKCCECGRIRIKDVCGVSSASGGDGIRHIHCDQACKIAQRNRALASALGLDHRLEDPLDGVAPNYSDELVDFARANLDWVRGVERRALEFIADGEAEGEGGAPRGGRMVLQFPPCKAAFRAFLHGLAEHYGCLSESVDPEPHRCVWWTRQRSQSSVPIVPVSEVAAKAIGGLRPTNGTLRLQQTHSASLSHGIDPKHRLTSLASKDLSRIPNVVLLRGLRIGMTYDELVPLLGRAIGQGSSGWATQHGRDVVFKLRWINDEDAAMWSSDYRAERQALMSADEHANILRRWAKAIDSRLVFDGDVSQVTCAVVDYPKFVWPVAVRDTKITIECPELKVISPPTTSISNNGGATQQHVAAPDAPKTSASALLGSVTSNAAVEDKNDRDTAASAWSNPFAELGKLVADLEEGSLPFKGESSLSNDDKPLPTTGAVEAEVLESWEDQPI
ncbi:FKBP12-associated protein [Spiromyces aspiralis]|uniref:FKBP12-associated protein n=1 Tax=Spiromyces aspiralis TaxID=68401 RepID=A0ACC1HH52_9FUNG|nr:FKBP12-associated protein [Spiromyces aspiralis]